MNKYYSYIIYLLISIFVVILYVNDFGPIDNLQRSLNDLLVKVTAPNGPRPNVVLVKIDGRAMSSYGEWPWNRDLIADLLAATASGEPKAIAVDIDLPQDPFQDSAGYTDTLAGQLTWITNAVLPYDIALATYRNKRTDNPKYLFNNSVTVDDPLGVMNEKSSLVARKVFLPAEKLLASYPRLGFDYHEPDEDRELRRQPMFLYYDGYYYPSLSLMTAAVYLGLKPEQIKIEEGREIVLGGNRKVPIDEQGRFYINFPKGSGFTTYSAADILGSGFDYSRLKNKVVLIGLDELNAYDIFDTPVKSEATALYVKASIIENIINDNIIDDDGTSAGFDMLLLFVLGGICAALLPRLTLVHRMILLLGLLILLANVNYFMLSSFRTITETIYIALELVLFALASPLLDSQLLMGELKASSETPRRKTPKAESKVIDSGKIRVRELKASDQDPEEISTSAIGYDEEPAVVDHQAISLDEPSHEDASTMASSVSEATKSFEHAEPAPVPEKSESQGPGPQIISADSLSDSDGMPEVVPTEAEDINLADDSQGTRITADLADIKNLGRYQISGVLGKGAMGLVYKGIDPAINRPVALKTIRLDFVNDPEELAELKERLHREAQAAGKLSHPNIVTIYDVGSQGQLQYIAMECLEGRTLEDMIKKKVKFNYRIIAQIIIQICNALDYAHEQGIVHRDVKPANIMVLTDYRVKVMDFGIARIDSNSMTKTGIAMGTPNYISPEQLKGLQPDRRADIFSLGVVMYEMLLGKRPFKGENITSLMYAIMHHEPEKPSTINPQVPLMFDRILERALKKNPGERFQKASEIAIALQDFVESFVKR